MTDTQQTPIPDAPKPAAVVKANAKPALAPGVKFQRDQGNFNPDGSKLLRDFDDTWTEDVCPKSPKNEDGIPTHDLARIQRGQQVNGKKLVECAYCHTRFASKEDFVPPKK